VALCRPLGWSGARYRFGHAVTNDQSAESGHDQTESDLDVVDRHDDREEGPDYSNTVAQVEAGWWSRQTLLALGLSLLIFLVLRPERFGLSPNSLDPFFYTGYAINFDDIMREIGDGRYFVSRWSAYLPSRLMSDIFGPSNGRLVLRWLIASGVLVSVWHLGRRWVWSSPTQVVVGVVVLANPIFARAFMTDYVEWVYASLGIILICQCLESRSTWSRSASIGLLSALIAVANPLAAILTIGPVGAYAVATFRRGRPFTAHLTIIAVAFLATAGLGLAYFRITSGIPNVYSPTLDFIRQNRDSPDLLKSPRLTWLGSFTWIYAPLILVGATLAISSVRTFVRRHPASRAAIALLGLQYLFQWADQFIRNGNGLEISYYWSIIVPALSVALAVFAGSVSWTRLRAGTFIAVWALLLAEARYLEIRLPAGWVFAVVACLVLLGCGIVDRATPTFGPTAAVSMALVVVLLSQTVAPRYDPSAYHEFNMDPRYGSVFFNAGSPSDRDLDEAIWLADQLDRLPSDAGIGFVVPRTGWQLPGESSSEIVGIYGPHVTGKWLPTDPSGNFLLDGADRLTQYAFPAVAVYGPSEYVDEAVSLVEGYVGVRSILDRSNPGGMNYRLVVLELINPAAVGATWPASTLRSQTGSIDGESRTATSGIDAPGFVTFGPYIQLAANRYTSQVTYRSPAPPDQTVGLFDVNLGADVIASVELTGTDGEIVEVSLDFLGSLETGWEFRSYWHGGPSITIEQVSVTPAGG